MKKHLTIFHQAPQITLFLLTLYIITLNTENICQSTLFIFVWKIFLESKNEFNKLALEISSMIEQRGNNSCVVIIRKISIQSIKLLKDGWTTEQVVWNHHWRVPASNKPVRVVWKCSMPQDLCMFAWKWQHCKNNHMYPLPVLFSLNFCWLNYWLFELLVVWTIARGTTCSSSK